MTGVERGQQADTRNEAGASYTRHLACANAVLAAWDREDGLLL